MTYRSTNLKIRLKPLLNSSADEGASSCVEQFIEGPKDANGSMELLMVDSKSKLKTTNFKVVAGQWSENSTVADHRTP